LARCSFVGLFILCELDLKAVEHVDGVEV